MSRISMPLGLCIASIFALAASLTGNAWSADPEATEPNLVRIGHYQCRCEQGDFEANLKTLLRGLKQAAEARLDIVSFPESFLTGYFGNEAQTRANSFAVDSPQMARVLRETAHFPGVLMVGFNESREDKLFNTVAAIRGGKILGTYSKAMPCFPFFTPGREFPVFEHKGLKFGVVICADGGYVEPCRIVAFKGARVIFAPHYNFLSRPVRHYQMVRNDHVARSVENGVYFLRGNTVDLANKIDGFDFHGYGYGDSYLMNPNGEIVAAAGLYHEYLLCYPLDLDKQHRSRPVWKSRKSAADLNDVYQQTLREVLGE